MLWIIVAQAITITIITGRYLGLEKRYGELELEYIKTCAEYIFFREEGFRE